MKLQKYNVPLVKVTGSQRVGLYGLKKEELPKVWEDLGMRSDMVRKHVQLKVV